MKRKLNLAAAAVALSLFLAIDIGWAQDWTSKAQEAVTKAMTEIGVPKGDSRLLVLTNAVLQVGTNTTGAFLNMLGKETGCTRANDSLLTVHTSIQEPLWCALYRKDTGKIVFFKWAGDGFGQQVIDASHGNILSPEGWKAASAGLVGKNLFSVVSISLSWAANPPASLLLACSFHDHLCPGLNAGYIFVEYMMEKLPLRPGDRYVTVTAPGNCPADAFQVLLNTTAGKGGAYAMAISDETLAKYSKGNVKPWVVAMRVNEQSDVCEGVVLGLDWDKVLADTGVSAEKLFSKGSDPWGPIARVQTSVGLAKIPKERFLEYVVELRRFSGKASLAGKVAGGDPYAVVWAQ